MKFRRLRLAVFGPHVDRELELPTDRVLIYGANTAGKTTFREALETVLYGFDPARRESHPLWTWNEGAALHLEADLEPASGNAFRVERTMQATGKHRRAGAGADFVGTRLSNAALSEVSGTSRAMFRAVYGLSLDNLNDFDDSLSEDIDRLLLPVHEGIRLRPTRDVIRELEGEHRGLWHRDKRRGKVSQQIKDARREFRQNLKQARESEDALREGNAELEEINARLPHIDDERRRIEREDAEAGALKQIFEQRRRVAQLPDPPDMAVLEESGLEDPRRIQTELSAREKELEPSRERLRREPIEFSEADQRVVGLTQAIEALEPGRHEEQLNSAAERVKRARELKQQLAAGIAELVTGNADARHLETLRAVSLEAVGVAIKDWTEAEARTGAARSVVAGRRFAGVGLLLAGVALFVVGMFVLNLDWLASTGALLAGAGIVTIVFARDTRNAQRTQSAAPPELRMALDALPVEPALLASPQAALTLAERLRDLCPRLSEFDDLEEEIAISNCQLGNRMAGWQKLAREVRGEFEFEFDSEDNTASLARQLQATLKRAQSAYQQMQQDQRERAAAQREIDIRAPDLDRVRRRLLNLTRVLNASVSDQSDLGVAFDTLRLREEQRRKLGEEGERLKRDLDFENLLARLPEDPSRLPDPLPWDDDITSRRRQRHEELVRERDAKLQRRGELDQLLRDSKGSESARILEQLDALDEQLRDVSTERDRLALLMRILGEADRLYREEHQPDVLRNANRYLEIVTGGAMKRLEYGGNEGGVLQVTPEGRDEPVPVAAPLSRGTRDQIHLCLRLGLLDDLDKDGEPLPLVLDEALVNWDAERRERIYPLLREVSTRRQVFLLTCHDFLAVEAERELDIRRIEL